MSGLERCSWGEREIDEAEFMRSGEGDEENELSPDAVRYRSEVQAQKSTGVHEPIRVH